MSYDYEQILKINTIYVYMKQFELKDLIIQQMNIKVSVKH